jgi:prepilin-type N-terminal cleavage/methylation domain-containing protein
MKSERGFTLIELLVVIAIMAVLFGVTALALTGVGSNAEAEAARAEGDVVQTAIDVYLAVDSSHTVAGAACEQAGDGADQSASFDTYLRRTTRFYLGWDSNGTVTGVFDAAGCATQLWP